MYFRRTILLTVAFTLLAVPASSQENERPNVGAGSHNATTLQSPKPSSPEGEVASGILGHLPADSVTNRVLKTGMGELAYTATAGTISNFGQYGTLSAKLFYTAYVARDRQPDRPLTFAFNGGPGAASAYLHLGLAGPRILDFGPNGRDGTESDSHR